MGRKLEDRSNRTWPLDRKAQEETLKDAGENYSETTKLVNYEIRVMVLILTGPLFFNVFFKLYFFISVQHFLCSFSILSIITYLGF